jgi:hypothetical protein
MRKIMAEKNQPQLPAVNALISVDEKLPNPKLNSGKRKTRREAWKTRILEDILETEKQQLPSCFRSSRAHKTG